MGRITSLLKKVNELTVGGLRKAAIDLLSEYVEDQPKDSTVYKTLGRLYLLEGNKEKSIEYLRKASDETFSDNEHQHIDNQYDPHAIDEDDFDFIEASAISNNNIHVYEYEEESSSSVQSNNIPPESRTLTLKTKRIKTNNDIDEPGTSTKVSYRKRHPRLKDKAPGNEKIKEALPDSNKLDDVDFFPQKQLGLFSDTDINQKNVQSSAYKEQPKNSEETTIPQNKKPIKKATDRNDHVEVDFLPQGKLNSHTLTEENKTEQADNLESDILDQLDEDIGDWNEFDFLDENDDSEIDKPKKLKTDTFDDSDEDTFAWDEFDDLEEIAEEELRAEQEEVDTNGKLTPKQRAKQIAAGFINESGWDVQHLEFLTEVFETRGWSAIKRVLLKACEKGMAPEELYLAFEIREIWKNSSQYWMTFSRIKFNAPGQQAEARYCNLSWAEAFRIIRVFPSYPSSEELALFLESEFDNWYNSASSRRAFKTFLRYLKYRIGSLHSALPRDIFYSFNNPIGYDHLFDNKRYEFLGSPEHKIINDYGIEAFENISSRVSVFDHTALYHDDDLLKESTLAVINSSHKVR